MNRYKFAFGHFLVSCFIFSTTFFIVKGLWYPGPFFDASGGWEGLKIAASVDLVLGPLLMLVIFNPAKGRLKLIFDIATIISIQFAALVFGVATIYQQRPIAAVFWEDSFYTVPASALSAEEINKIDHKPELNLYYAKKPESTAGLTKIYNMVTEHQKPPYQQIWLYHDLKPSFSEIKPYAVNTSKTLKNDVLTKLINDYLSEKNVEGSELLFFNMFSKYKNIILIFDLEANLVDYLNVDRKGDN
jgi:hypothetical protein